MHGVIKIGDFGAESRALLAELLGAFRLVPDGRVSEFERNLLEALFLQIVFKETPSRRRHAPRDLSGYV
jgi:hypothetical protein